jgi:hypothetical protein
MAGVIAHNKAIVSSANARILVTLISVLLFLTTTNKLLTSSDHVSPPLTTTAVTVITALKLTETVSPLPS